MIKILAEIINIKEWNNDVFDIDFGANFCSSDKFHRFRLKVVFFSTQFRKTSNYMKCKTAHDIDIMQSTKKIMPLSTFATETVATFF